MSSLRRPQFARTANNEHAQLIEGSTPLQNSTGLAVGGDWELTVVLMLFFLDHGT